MLNNKYDTASRQRVNIGKCIPCVKQEKASVFQLCRGVMECQMITRVAANNEGTVSCVPIGGGMWRADAVWLAAVPILQKLEPVPLCLALHARGVEDPWGERRKQSQQAWWTSV